MTVNIMASNLLPYDFYNTSYRSIKVYDYLKQVRPQLDCRAVKVEVTQKARMSTRLFRIILRKFIFEKNSVLKKFLEYLKDFD